MEQVSADTISRRLTFVVKAFVYTFLVVSIGIMMGLADPLINSRIDSEIRGELNWFEIGLYDFIKSNNPAHEYRVQDTWRFAVFSAGTAFFVAMLVAMVMSILSRLWIPSNTKS